MSKDTKGNNDFQHRKQPIHFYQPSKPSDQNNFHSSGNKTFGFSPSKYSCSKLISPTRPNLGNGFIKNGQSSLKGQRSPGNQLYSSFYQHKYNKFSSKLEMLQKNLNRLYGQHQSLKSLFEKSQQLVNKCNIFEKMQKLKQKIQQIRINKFIHQKRMQARYEIVFEQYYDRFSQIQTDLFVKQGQKIYQIQKVISKKIKQNEFKIQKHYNNHFEVSSKIINQIQKNTQKYLREIDTTLQNQALKLFDALKIEQKINIQKQKLINMVQNIKIKSGQLKCITEYEMFLEKQHQISHQLSLMKKDKLTLKLNSNQKLKDDSFQALQLKFLKDQSKFVGQESLDRLSIQVANTDLKFVQILQKYKTKKERQKKEKKKGRQNTQNIITSQTLTFQNQINNIESMIFQVNYQIKGLKKYIKKSIKSIQNLQKQKYFTKDKLETQIQAKFEEAINDLQNKTDKLSSNLTYFKQKLQQN